jgi:hypothetical protein
LPPFVDSPTTKSSVALQDNAIEHLTGVMCQSARANAPATLGMGIPANFATHEAWCMAAPLVP